MIEIRTTSPSETLALGRRLSPLLMPGDVVLLSGRLGCGKTLFTGGICEGLGVTEPVTSPSFVLAKTYQGFVPIVHADVYRLGTTAEFDDLDLPDAAADGVLIVEWGEAVEAAAPVDHLLVRIDILDDEERRFTFIPVGAWQHRDLKDLAA